MLPSHESVCVYALLSLTDTDGLTPAQWMYGYAISNKMHIGTQVKWIFKRNCDKKLAKFDIFMYM